MRSSLADSADDSWPAASDEPVPHYVHITQTKAFSYRVPGKKSLARPLNFLVELRGRSSNGLDVVGAGEGQPRGQRTGDESVASWGFLEDVIADLEGRRFPIGSQSDSIRSVREVMQHYGELALEHRSDTTQRRPFRGTLFGVEVALLDLIAQAHRVPLADLLGRVRETAPITPPVLSAASTFEGVRKTLVKQNTKYTVIRVPGRRNVDKTLDSMETVAAVARRRDVGQGDKSLWVDFNGSLDRESASYFVRAVVDSAVSGLLPKRVVIEQPVPEFDGDYLPVLQEQIASRLGSRAESPDIRIMGDESVWDRGSLEDIGATGGLSGVNIRPAQSGGLIPSIDLAQAALTADPHALIVVTRMGGASRLTSSALRHLSMALPQINGATVVSSVDKYINITESRSLDGESGGDERRSVPIEDTHETVQAEADSRGSDEAEHEEADDTDVTDAVDRSSNAAEESKPEALEAEETQDENEEDLEDDADDESPLRSFAVGAGSGIGIGLVHTELIKPTIRYAVYPMPAAPSFGGKMAATYDDVAYIRPLGPYGVHGHVVEREALAYGLNSKRFNKSTFLVDDGGEAPLAFRTARWPLSSVVASSIVRHKESTRLLLNRHRVPVPRGRTFANGDSAGALEFAERIGYPVVLKPAEGSMGVGVTANIANAIELESALARLQGSVMGSGEFIVEQHVPGRDYRIMVIGDEVVAAVERIPASVVGDGTSTVAELILAKNAIRRLNSHLGPLKLKWDASTAHELGKQGLHAQSVLDEGYRLYLNSVNNLTQGGDSVEILDELHPSIIQASIDAVRAVPGLTYCGVDFLLEDHATPLDEQNGAVCELNAVAAIPVAEYPVFGTPRPLSEKFLRRTIEDFNLRAFERRADTLSLHMKVRGKVTGVGYEQWFARRARQFGCLGWIRNVSNRELEIRVSGPTAATTALATAAVLGPPRAFPTSVYTTHGNEFLTEEFEVLSARNETEEAVTR